MSESQEYGINNGSVDSSAAGDAPTTAQTVVSNSYDAANSGYVVGTDGSQNTYNTAGVYAPPTTVYTSAPQQQFYSLPQYVQGTPVYTQSNFVQSTEKKHRFSTPARVLMWICGIAASVTLLFGCAVLWMLGIRALQNAVATPETSNGSGSGGYYSGDDYGFGYGYGGGFEDFPDYGDFGSMLPYFDIPSTPAEASSAGLGISAAAIELEFDIDGIYSAGLVIVKINEGSSFEGTEARENDLIVAMDGTKTPDLNTLKTLLGKKQPGDSAELTIARYEKGVASTYELTVTLIDMDDISDDNDDE